MGPPRASSTVRLLNALIFTLYFFHASLVAQTVKSLPAMWETRVRFLGREDPLEKEMAIHSSTRAWKIPWTEEPDRLQSMGSQRVRHNWATSIFLSFFRVEYFSKHLLLLSTPWAGHSIMAKVIFSEYIVVSWEKKNWLFKSRQRVSCSKWFDFRQSQGWKRWI